MKCARAVAVLYIGLLVACTSSTATDTLNFPAAAAWCQDAPWCEFESVEKKWPVTSEQIKLAPITNLTFIVGVPRDYSKLSLIWGELPTFAVHYQGYRIVVELEEITDIKTMDGMRDLVEAQKLSKRLPIDQYEILFTAKPEQTEPANLYDRWLWRSAFSIKSSLYKSTKLGEIYRQGDWNVYLADVEGVSDSRITIITHRALPARYLKILDDGAPKAIILEIIASIKLDQADALKK